MNGVIKPTLSENIDMMLDGELKANVEKEKLDKAKKLVLKMQAISSEKVLKMKDATKNFRRN